MHWGGGTPNFLSREEMSELVASIDSAFTRGEKTECAIELDPRSAEPGRMEFLAALGFTRLDRRAGLRPCRAEGGARVQSGNHPARHGRGARARLQVGQPRPDLRLAARQSLDSFNRTLDEVLALEPDRIALYNYAHLPKLFKPQRRIVEAELPSPELKLELMTLAIGRLTRAATCTSAWTISRARRTSSPSRRSSASSRSFQGYRHTRATSSGWDFLDRASRPDLLPERQGARPLLRRARRRPAAGVARRRAHPDDLARRAVIQALMCHFRVSIESIELSYLLDFNRHFAAELHMLKKLADDGLVELSPTGSW